MNNLFEEIQRVTKNYKRSKFRGSVSSFKLNDVSKFDSKNASLRILPDDTVWNSVLFFGIILLVLLSFLGKSFKLQVIEGEDNLVLSEGNRIRVIYEQAERGLVLDRNGEILVRNKPSFSIEMNTESCLYSGVCETELKRFTDTVNLKIDKTRILDDLDAKKANIVIASSITKEELLGIESKISEFPNISITVVPERDYLYSDAFAHLIGYVGFGDTLYPTIEGKAGVEDSYDDLIKGVSGGEIIQVDSSGKKLSILSEKLPIPGKDVQLYVDKGLQVLAYKLLKEKVDLGEATAGVVVAQDPQTGGILALVNYPAFDPNKISFGITVEEFSKLANDKSAPFFNRAISGGYPPASTFKMVMAAATLMEEIVGEYYQITDTGSISVGSYVFRNWNLGGHGLVDLRRALQVSNDTYFYTMGGGYGGVKGLGIKKISEWAEKFGFGFKTGIDIAGEIAGFMPDGTHRDWYLGDTYIASIGQSDILSTPLQVNNVTSYYGNGGFLFEPRVVKSAAGVEYDTEVISQNLIDLHTYEVVREGLKMAVEPGGTGYPVYDFPQRVGVELGGKTGTAEFGAYENEDTHAWFTVFGPYEEASIALTVFLEEGGSGSSDAAPIARELLNYWFDADK